jgi:hypothetical protein
MDQSDPSEFGPESHHSMEELATPNAQQDKEQALKGAFDTPPSRMVDRPNLLGSGPINAAFSPPVSFKTSGSRNTNT